MWSYLTLDVELVFEDTTGNRSCGYDILYRGDVWNRFFATQKFWRAAPSGGVFCILLGRQIIE